MKTKKLLSVLLFLSLLISTLSLPVFASDIIKEPRKTALSASSIFTEEYCVEYTENPDGSLTLDSSSFNDLISLSYDNSALEKIVFDKETSTKKEKFNQDSFSVESSPAIADSEWKTYLRELKKQKSNNEVFTVSDQNTVSVIKSISNFYSDIVLLSQTPTAQGVELDVAYLWIWYYSPVMTLSDIVSLTWSEGFNNDSRYTTFNYVQSGYRRKFVNGILEYDYSDTSVKTALHLEGDHACSSISAAVGYQKTFDIKRSFTLPDGREYLANEHSGYFKAKVTRNKFTATDSGSITFVGDYFHQSMKPDLTLTLTPDGPEGSLGLSVQYEQATPVSRTFDYW